MDTIQDLAVALKADFDLRGGGVAVDFGNWQSEIHAGADRIVLGLGTFDPDAQNFPPGQSPGAVNHGATAAVTVALRAQEVIAWVHGVAPGGTSEAAVAAASHARASVLLDATTAALRRILGRGALVFGKGDWPSAAQGDVTYGALARFRFFVAIPVLGDAYAVVPKPYSVTAEILADLPGGEVQAAETAVE